MTQYLSLVDSAVTACNSALTQKSESLFPSRRSRDFIGKVAIDVIEVIVVQHLLEIVIQTVSNKQARQGGRHATIKITSFS